MIYSKRTDKNHKQIKRELEQCGFTVYDFSKCGWGIPDLLVVLRGVGRWVEVKSKTGKLRPLEIVFMDICPGPPVIVARTTEDVLDAFECIQLD